MKGSDLEGEMTPKVVHSREELSGITIFFFSMLLRFVFAIPLACPRPPISTLLAREASASFDIKSTLKLMGAPVGEVAEFFVIL